MYYYIKTSYMCVSQFFHININISNLETYCKITTSEKDLCREIETIGTHHHPSIPNNFLGDSPSVRFYLTFERGM